MSDVAFSFSVKELADFSGRSGDLELVSVAGPTAQEGIQGHQRWQAKQKTKESNYQAEYSIEHFGSQLGYNYRVGGRVDGVLFSPVSDCENEEDVEGEHSGNEVVKTIVSKAIAEKNETQRPIWIEEIKTTYVEVEQLTEAIISIQLAQLKYYGFLIANKFELPEIELRLVWIRLPRERETIKSYRFNIDELTSFFERGVQRYLSWLVKVEEHRLNLRKSCSELMFPFSGFRENQRALCAEVFRRIRSEQSLVFEAPTGIGKTISVLFPAFKSYGEGFVDQVIFATAKQSGRVAVSETCDLLNQQIGLELSSSKHRDSENNASCKGIKSLSISAKDSTCFCAMNAKNSMVQVTDEEGRTREVCKYKRGFYDRLPDALNTSFDETNLDKSRLLEIAEDFQLCPFSLSLILTKWFDLVVLDVNYIFDPLIQLAHFEQFGKSQVVLVDEGHNLIDRSRQMYSADIIESDALNVLQETQHKTFFTKQINRLSSVLVAVEELAKSTSTEQSRGNAKDNSEWRGGVLDSALIEKLHATTQSIQANLFDFSLSESLSELEMSWLKQIIRFNVILSLRDDAHQFFISHQTNGLIDTLNVHLICLNAANYLEQIYKNLRSLIVFSGTLRPDTYVAETLGFRDALPIKRVPSIFSHNQLGVFISTRIDTRYRYRDGFIQAIVADIKAVIESKAGNYMVAFSSYHLLEKVAEEFAKQFPKTVLSKQERASTLEQKEEFISQFFNQRSVLGFVILGGVYTEGVDYRGDSLDGVIVVGSGMPQVNQLQAHLTQYFEGLGLSGFDMTYRYPALQRVFQTTGRVIRQLSDKGVVVLLDKRFAEPRFLRMAPEYWSPKCYRATDQLQQALQEFWLKNEQ